MVRGDEQSGLGQDVEWLGWRRTMYKTVSVPSLTLYIWCQYGVKFIWCN